MVCANCGKETEPASKFCAFCGAEISPNDSLPLVDVPQPGSVTDADSHEPAVPSALADSVLHPQLVASPPRPWVRFWARVLDINLFIVITSIIVIIALFIILFNPGVFKSRVSVILLVLFFLFFWLFFWMFFEAFLLSTVGTTPGKWLLKTRVLTSSGGKPAFSTALFRTFKVCWRGMGLGIPIVTLITHIVAYNRLEKNGVTSWDKDAGLVVVHERIGVIRTLVVILIFAACLFLYVTERR